MPYNCSVPVARWENPWVLPGQLACCAHANNKRDDVRCTGCMYSSPLAAMELILADPRSTEKGKNQAWAREIEMSFRMMLITCEMLFEPPPSLHQKQNFDVTSTVPPVRKLDSCLCCLSASLSLSVFMILYKKLVIFWDVFKVMGYSISLSLSLWIRRERWRGCLDLCILFKNHLQKITNFLIHSCNLFLILFFLLIFLSLRGLEIV